MQKETKMNFKIPVIIEKDHGEYHAFCPVFKGIHINGETEEEAFENTKDAIEAYIMSLIKHNEPIPLYAFETESRKKQRKLSRFLALPKHDHLKHVIATI